ncbi:hypothetical protein ILYODFUR_000687 [Ilyodon furcidens]|uniref:Uncharacterized protein n=1 Tax=Ilyodon furcidens TaxID=33524 RepID=A0ABV0T5K3_9TELE
MIFVQNCCVILDFLEKQSLCRFIMRRNLQRPWTHSLSRIPEIQKEGREIRSSSQQLLPNKHVKDCGSRE